MTGFIVQGWHLRDPAIAGTLGEYSALVCNPSLDPNQIRELAPEAKLWCYYHAHAPFPRYGVGNEFFAGLREAVGDHLEIDRGGTILHPGANAYELQLDFDAYEDYAKWIVDHLDGWDGVYLDEAWDIPDQRWLDRCGRDRMDTTVRWAALMEYLRYKLSGPIIVANIGPPSLGANSPNHRLWDAISLEENHLARFNLPTLAALYSSMRNPAFNVAWWTDLSFPGLVMPGIRLPEEQP